MRHAVIPLFIVLLGSVLSCTKYLNPMYVDIVSLGASVKCDTLGKDPESCIFRLTSNVDFEASIVSGAEWLCFEKDGSSRISCPASTRNVRLRAVANHGFPRMGLVVLEAQGRADTLYVKQEGEKMPFVSIAETSLTADPNGGTYSFKLETNLPARDIRTSVDIDGIQSIRYDESILTIVITPNSGRNDRCFHVDVFSITGWRDSIGSTITISQKKL